ncbi:MAG TPA: cell division protein FtsA [Vicinamibacteria bacterium]|nr:cell division protein FtsA [Vicinamibacteria bacterium]
MLNKRDRYIVGLDIGTTKVTAIVAEITEEGRVDVIGIGSTESKGLRKGMVINLGQTVESIKRVVEEAELMAGVEVESAHVGLAGSHIKGFNSRAVVAITNKSREITREDVFRAIDAAKAISLPNDREIVHVIPQEFVVDGHDGIHDPTGMTGNRLEANVHIITASTTAMANVVTCINRAGMEVTETVLEQLAAAEAVLTPDEKELGVAFVDIGGGTTDLAIFDKGAIWHTAVLPIGGDHFTNDVAVGLRTPIQEAEKIKKKYGTALSTMVSEEDTIEVPSVGGRKARVLSRQLLADILQPRAEEICHLIYDEIRRTGYERVLNSGVVFTGGSASLEGLLEVADRIFDMPIRCGTPTGVGGLVDVIANPSYGTAVGLVLYAHRIRSNKLVPSAGTHSWWKVWERVRKLVHVSQMLSCV